jgi:hypothetical protein
VLVMKTLTVAPWTRSYEGMGTLNVRLFHVREIIPAGEMNSQYASLWAPAHPNPARDRGWADYGRVVGRRPAAAGLIRGRGMLGVVSA